MISAHIFGSQETGHQSPVWESLDSLSGFCDRITVHDHGMPPEISAIVEDFSRIKRMVVVDTVPRPLSEMDDDEWLYFGVLNEVVHEDNHHYFLDLTSKHSKFLGVDIFVKTVFSDSHREQWTETRIARRRALGEFKFDGDRFSCSISHEKRSLPDLVPSPIWKFSRALGSNTLENEEQRDLIIGANGLPQSMARLAGRYLYKPPYMNRRG